MVNKVDFFTHTFKFNYKQLQIVVIDVKHGIKQENALFFLFYKIYL